MAEASLCLVELASSRARSETRLLARSEASSQYASSQYARLYARGKASLQYASLQYARLYARGEASSQYARFPVQTRENVAGAESSPIPMRMGHGITNSPTGIVPGGLSQKIDLAKKSRLFSKSQKTSDHKSGKTMGNEFGIYPIHSATLCESAMRSRSRWT